MMADAGSKGTIIVTGANGTLGSAIARQIAAQPDLSAHHGIYTVRDTAATPNLTSALARGSPNHQHDILALDLTNLADVRRLAADIQVSREGAWSSSFCC